LLRWIGCGRRGRRVLCAAILTPFLAIACIAQEAYSHRLWQAADGLPTDVVQAFAETQDHALWIGTTDGLVRFDGSRFRYYRRDNTPALGADSVFCLTVTRDGTLWIGIEGGGLVRYRDGQLTRLRNFNQSIGKRLTTFERFRSFAKLHKPERISRLLDVST